MSRGHASSEEVSFVGTMPSVHLRRDASKGAAGCESAGTPYCPPMEGVSVLAHTCASTGFGAGASRTCDRERQTRRRVELLVSSQLTLGRSLSATPPTPRPWRL